MPRNFWMITCNAENYAITRNLGFTIQGLKVQHQRKVQRIEPGDRILYYVYGIRRFTGTATATSPYFEDSSPIWRKEGRTGWPYRIHIKPEVVMDEDQYMDANQLAPRLEYIRRWPPENWYMAFQGNLHLLPKGDFVLIEEEMKKLKFGRNYNQNVGSQPQSLRRERSASPRRRRSATTAPASSGPAPDA